MEMKIWDYLHSLCDKYPNGTMKKLKSILLGGVAVCTVYLCCVLSMKRFWMVHGEVHKRDYGGHRVDLFQKDKDRAFQGVGTDVSDDSPSYYYCNFPSHKSAEQAEEGKPPNSNCILKQVQILIRHGDRSPIGSELYEKLNVRPTYCKIDLDEQPSHPSLQRYVKTMEEDFTRMRMEGKKFFSSPYPNEPVCGSASLSQLGVVQHIFQGELLRKIYIEGHGLLSDVVSTASAIASKVFVSSTMRSRTIQSAFAFLYGFLPDFRMSQVQIQYSKSDLFRSSRCKAELAMKPAIDYVRHKTYIQRQKSNSTFRKIADLFHFSDHSGPLIDGFVTGFLCKYTKLPCMKSECTTVDDLDVLLEEEKYLTRVMSEQSPIVNQSILAVHPLLTKIDQMMQRRIWGNNSAPDFSLFSGHDTTLKPMIRALGIPEYRWPRLGSRLTFELWYDPVEREHYVRILLNGKDYTSSTRFCQTPGEQDLVSSGACTHSHFQDYLQHSMQRHFSKASLEEACKP